MIYDFWILDDMTIHHLGQCPSHQVEMKFVFQFHSHAPSLNRGRYKRVYVAAS